MMFSVQWNYVTASGRVHVEAEAADECRHAVAAKLNPENAATLAADPALKIYVEGAIK